MGQGGSSSAGGSGDAPSMEHSEQIRQLRRQHQTSMHKLAKQADAKVEYLNRDVARAREDTMYVAAAGGALVVAAVGVAVWSRRGISGSRALVTEVRTQANTQVIELKARNLTEIEAVRDRAALEATKNAQFANQVRQSLLIYRRLSVYFSGFREELARCCR